MRSWEESVLPLSPLKEFDFGRIAKLEDIQDILDGSPSKRIRLSKPDYSTSIPLNKTPARGCPSLGSRARWRLPGSPRSPDKASRRKGRAGAGSRTVRGGGETRDESRWTLRERTEAGRRTTAPSLSEGSLCDKQYLLPHDPTVLSLQPSLLPEDCRESRQERTDSRWTGSASTRPPCPSSTSDHHLGLSLQQSPSSSRLPEGCWESRRDRADSRWTGPASTRPPCPPTISDHHLGLQPSQSLPPEEGWGSRQAGTESRRTC